MQVINQSNNSVLATDAVIANTVFKRMKGLLGRREFQGGQALVIKPCNSVHTLFMRFPIDVLFLDSNNRIVKAIANMKPFRISGIYFQASFVIELPSGTLEKTSTSAGDILLLN